jgi:hypothetical protein
VKTSDPTQAKHDRAFLVAQWEQHCADAGHTTQAQAFDQGKRTNTAKYATYEMSPTSSRIYCGLRSCDWRYPEK